jgi:hypothetical protein
MTSRSASHQERTTKISVEQSVPDFRGEPLEVLKGYRLIHRCVVDEDIEAAEGANGCLDCGFAGCGILLVQMNEKRLSALRFNLATHRDTFIAVTQMRQCDMCSLGGKRSRNHGTQAAGRARNQCCSIA